MRPSATTAAIVGLGLDRRIDGARSRRRAGFASAATTRTATASLAASARASSPSALDEIARGMWRRADVVVIAVPVDAAVGVLRRSCRTRSARALITDVGSTKARIVEAATELGIGERFVGSHPMAGDHRSGWESSRAGLFVDARRLSLSAAQRDLAAIERALRPLARARRRPTPIAAEEHDRKLAWTSHLPHMRVRRRSRSPWPRGCSRATSVPAGAT